jgi:hypothetical protein
MCGRDRDERLIYCDSIASQCWCDGGEEEGGQRRQFESRKRPRILETATADWRSARSWYDPVAKIRLSACGSARAPSVGLVAASPGLSPPPSSYPWMGCTVKLRDTAKNVLFVSRGALPLHAYYSSPERTALFPRQFSASAQQHPTSLPGRLCDGARSAICAERLSNSWGSASDWSAVPASPPLLRHDLAPSMARLEAAAASSDCFFVPAKFRPEIP